MADLEGFSARRQRLLLLLSCHKASFLLPTDLCSALDSEDRERHAQGGMPVESLGNNGR
jgi:hypothetical protein